MRRYGPGDAGLARVAFDQLPKGLAGEVVAAAGGEEKIAGAAAEDVQSRSPDEAADPLGGLVA